ncbi:Lipase 2 [Termitomyces sp. T112]|nr:hypothetical protein C0989_009625 [Termitomyces sp. Mn162]KAG5718003.1 Lipase 2 [Termitomyces sp. T112]KAH0582495.1 hypothetical protein H2248_010438 [Termitomyces sp. 'cryptogamus']KNZ72528.1 Lipase 2 [Termitomyces sp. J132]
MLLSLLPALLSFTVVSAASVQVGRTSFVGNYDTTTGVEEFLGIKYGTATRFRQATPVSYSTRNTINATIHGPACPQIKGTNSLAVDYGIYGTDEDCTLLDIQRPHSIPPGKLLPVMVWLHGGALTQGASWYYSGNGIVQQSTAIGMPVITVIIQYRLAAWGFLGGSEASANGAQNLGLYDQKLALQWIQDNIKSFNGDNSKVTVFGQSSGAMSITYHMLNVNTMLFSGAILESGTTTSVPCLPSEKYQGNYEALVGIVGCGGAADTFECLRTVDRDVLIDATNVMFSQPLVYGSRPWGVTIDGDIIPASPSILTAQGKFAEIPIIAGNVMDEGTIFVKPQSISADADLLIFLENDYRNRNASFFQNITSIQNLLSLYPDDPTLGSPFGTGNVTFFGEQFKRAAAVYGDIHFQWPRRNFLSAVVAKGVDAWSYIFDQFTSTNAQWQGVYHTGEIPYVFMKFTPADEALYTLAKQVHAYWVSFAYNRDPNFSKNQDWDRYHISNSNIVFVANATFMQPDTFRVANTNFIGSISDQLLEAKL